MPYTIRHTDEPTNGSITVEDRTIDESTSLKFPGKNVTSYGSIIGENFLHLLENFASTAAPQNPVAGQLWYNTTPGQEGLFVYDSSLNPIAAGGVKKSTSEPAASNSLIGDLWVNTTTQQLYLYTGSNWLLVGPEFSEGLSTGFKIESIVGKDNVAYTVMTIEVQAKPVVIISSNLFEPKAAINGFPQIQPGINLSTVNINNQGIAEYHGPANIASNLRVGNDVVSSTTFVRNDIENTLAEQLKIRNNNGIKIGEGQNFNFTVDGASASITNTNESSSIDLRLLTGTGVTPVIRVNADKTVGINKLDPQHPLDVNGTIRTNDKILVTGLEDATSINTGSIQTNGGLSIAKSLRVQGNTNLVGQTSVSGHIVPSVNNGSNLGSNSNYFGAVYASTYYGNFVGNISGTVTGQVNGAATSLASPTTFSLTGDVSSNSISFNGQQAGGVATFTTQIDSDFINNKTEASTIAASDELLLNQPNDLNAPLKKVTHAALLSSIPKMPPGIIMPYGGDSDPDPTSLGGGVWLLCDGREVLISEYPTLYGIIGKKFKGAPAPAHFGLPDMRGRIPLGADNMGGTSANRVTATEADIVGNASGSETHNIIQSELPDHTHDLYNDTNNRQYYASRYTPEQATTGTVSVPTSAGSAQTSSAILDVGGIKDYNTQTAMDIMNPYMTVNYIIYTGKDVT
jgi:microcystin-dependent protein